MKVTYETTGEGENKKATLQIEFDFAKDSIKKAAEAFLRSVSGQEEKKEGENHSNGEPKQ